MQNASDNLVQPGTSVAILPEEPAGSVSPGSPVSMAAEPVIHLDGLSVQFGGRPILKELRGELRGRAIGLLGPNGAGKTTLIHTLLGFHPASSGSARIFGRDIRNEAKQIRTQIGYMPERDSFISKMSCVHFVRLMAELSGLPEEAALERAHEALFYVGLGEARYRELGTYSLGMKQLAKLAQAIVHGPKLIFLDEPTNGLDPPARQRMIDLVRQIRDSGKAHILLSSHLLRDVEECCEEILIIKDGQIAVSCNLEEERKANRKFLELETRGNREAFVEAIGTLGCEYALTSERRLKLILQNDIAIRDLYQIARDHNVQIRRLNFKRDSLEDIFLKAMEGGNGGVGHVAGLFNVENAAGNATHAASLQDGAPGPRSPADDVAHAASLQDGAPGPRGPADDVAHAASLRDGANRGPADDVAHAARLRSEDRH